MKNNTLPIYLWNILILMCSIIFILQLYLWHDVGALLPSMVMFFIGIIVLCYFKQQDDFLISLFVFSLATLFIITYHFKLIILSQYPELAGNYILYLVGALYRDEDVIIITLKSINYSFFFFIIGAAITYKISDKYKIANIKLIFKSFNYNSVSNDSLFLLYRICVYVLVISVSIMLLTDAGRMGARPSIILPFSLNGIAVYLFQYSLFVMFLFFLMQRKYSDYKYSIILFCVVAIYLCLDVVIRETRSSVLFNLILISMLFLYQNRINVKKFIAYVIVIAVVTITMFPVITNYRADVPLTTHKYRQDSLIGEYKQVARKIILRVPGSEGLIVVSGLDKYKYNNSGKGKTYAIISNEKAMIDYKLLSQLGAYKYFSKIVLSRKDRTLSNPSYVGQLYMHGGYLYVFFGMILISALPISLIAFCNKSNLITAPIIFSYIYLFSIRIISGGYDKNYTKVFVFIVLTTITLEIFLRTYNKYNLKLDK
jgi:hypothetical protein